MTLRFLGDADVDEVRTRLDAVQSAAATAELGPALRRLGPNAIVVPVSGLDPLAAAIGDATGDLGQLPRPFHGHLTSPASAEGRSVTISSAGPSADRSGSTRCCSSTARSASTVPTTRSSAGGRRR